jgi:hypothetical protein
VGTALAEKVIRNRERKTDRKNKERKRERGGRGREDYSMLY